MNRKIVTSILLCAFILVSSCDSTWKLIGQNVGTAFVAFGEKKCFEIQERLVPRRYEGQSDSTMKIVITDEVIDTIPEWCFSRLSSLQEIIIRGNDVVVESNAFYACKNLQRGNLDNIIKCGENAFKMTRIDTVSLKRCEYIEDFAFANCSSLCYVSFSDSLRQIGDFAFSSDTALVKINVPNGEIGRCCFMGCCNLQDVTFGNVSVVGACAFLNCTSLSEIIIPETVLEIRSEAFAGCSNLKIVRIANRQTVIANNAFDNGTIVEYLY